MSSPPYTRLLACVWQLLVPGIQCPKPRGRARALWYDVRGDKWRLTGWLWRLLIATFLRVLFLGDKRQEERTSGGWTEDNVLHLLKALKGLAGLDEVRFFSSHSKCHWPNTDYKTNKEFLPAHTYIDTHDHTHVDSKCIGHKHQHTHICITLRCTVGGEIKRDGNVTRPTASSQSLKWRRVGRTLSCLRDALPSSVY